MANSIATAAIFQEELDRAFEQQALTGWMDANAGQVRYEGGAEIKIPKMTLSGLGDYSPSTGYPEGDVTVAWETRTMTQDRARSFDIDAREVDESHFTATAANVLSVFQQEYVNPEVDAYRLSALASMATSDHVDTTALTKANAFGRFLDALAALRDEVGSGAELVCHMTPACLALISQSTEFTRSVSLSDFTQGGITTQVRHIDGVPILETRSALMKDAYTFGSDGFAPQEASGSGDSAVAAAKQMHFVIAARRAPIAVCKLDVPRIFDPQTYQKKHAWHIDYRRFHDMWVMDNKKKGIFVQKN